MAKLIDSNLWIGLTRARSPRELKSFIAPHVLHPQACLAEPIIFELLRNATDVEVRQLTNHFQTLPLLASPLGLWSLGVDLGRSCRRAGLVASSMDLLIAAIAIHHDAELVTFDIDFQRLAAISKLRVQLLKSP